MIYLNTNHSGLNKFDGPEDENFALLLPEIERMVKNAPSIVISRYRHKGMELMRTTSFRAKHIYKQSL